MSNSNFDKNAVDKSGTHWLQYAEFVVTVFDIYFGQLILTSQLLLLPFDYSYVFVEFSSNLFNSKSSFLLSSLYFPVGTSNLIFIILTRFNDLTLYPKASHILPVSYTHLRAHET